MDKPFGYGDPEAEEALKLILRVAAAIRGTFDAQNQEIQNRESTEVTNRLRNDPRLLAWFVIASGFVANTYAYKIIDGYPDEEFEDGLEAIEYGIGKALRGEPLDEEDDDEEPEG